MKLHAIERRLDKAPGPIQEVDDRQSVVRRQPTAPATSGLLDNHQALKADRDDSHPAMADTRTLDEKKAAVEQAAEDAADLLTDADDLSADIEAELMEIVEIHELQELAVKEADGSWNIAASINPHSSKTAKKGKGPTKKKALKVTKQPTKKGVVKKRRMKKAREPRYTRGTLSPKFDKNADYSDSEDESTTFNQKHGYGGNIRNITKAWNQKDTPKKVNNTVNKSGLKAAVRQLMKDATDIHDVIPKKDRGFGATTVSTVVVHRVDGKGYRKFVFCNLKGTMPPALRKLAEGRGYHVITAPQAHAEGEMIQYFKSREGIYDLHSMGCDKDHCAECEWAMKIYFKTPTTEGSFSGKTFKNWYNPTALQEALGQADAATNKRDDSGSLF